MSELTTALIGSKWNRRPRHTIEDADVAELSKDGTLILPMFRERLLRYLPSRARVAEIGVAQGNFSSQIRAATSPSFYALVDLWGTLDEATVDSARDKVEQAEHDGRYNKVHRKFHSNRAGRECRLVRKLSTDAAKDFDDGFFDWVYVDANHTYEAALEDMQAWAPKVKADGLILGHDFAVHGAARKAGFGVIEAVRQFTTETGFSLLAFTVEHFPTFVIAKNPAGETAQRFKRLIYSYENHIIRLDADEMPAIGHVRIKDNYSRPPRRALMSIASPSRRTASA